MRLQFIQRLSMLFIFALVGISVSYANLNIPNITKKTYSGFLITTSGDTLKGKIQMLSITMNQVKVKFINEKGKRRVYRAKDLQSYSFKVKVWNRLAQEYDVKWILYTKKTVEKPPVPFSSNKVLVQQEVIGNISIYNYYIETRSNQSIEHIVYLEKDDILYVVDKTNYKKILSILMADFPFMKDKVGTKNYTYKHLNATIKEYNRPLGKSIRAIVNKSELIIK